ncbi:HNH endonuclease [Pseudomonas sp. UFMG81]|uniref:HNH endonuclease n=1 Tax=Pseudomonas sp. UFMG81 TaxID=2745936 RepID=UPI00188ED21D|nr:HNH endonuclease [Pseudomonas sp. UFMG81]
MNIESYVELDRDEQAVLDSLMPGGRNWYTFRRTGSCLQWCSFYKRCQGGGPEDNVCSTDWRKATVDDDSLGVFVHVLGSFDFYNRDDIVAVGQASPVISGLLEKFVDARDELTQSAGIVEGSKKLRNHLRTERKGRAYHKLKLQRLSEQGALRCEACETDFHALLGDKATRVIECHHQLPLAHEAHSGITKIEDLVLLCANCHRIAHSDEALLGITALREFVRKGH